MGPCQPAPLHGLCNAIVLAFQSRAEGVLDEYGRSAQQLTDDFRARLRIGIALACARGTALVQGCCEQGFAINDDNDDVQRWTHR